MQQRVESQLQALKCGEIVGVAFPSSEAVTTAAKILNLTFWNIV